MLQRKIIGRLREWRRTRDRQGLLITGARQVGKTTAVEEFAHQEYENLSKIGFVERPEAIDLITGGERLR